MATSPQSQGPAEIPIRSIVVFVVTAFVASYALAFAVMAAGLGGWWVQAAAVSGPTIATLVALRLERAGIRQFFATMLFAHWPDWRLLTFVPVMIALAFPALMLAGGEASAFLDTWTSGAAFWLLAFNILIVALLEEIGWRGYLTRKLLPWMAPFYTSLVVGVIWALWHGPKLFSVPMLGAAAIALSFPMTFLVATRRAGLIGCILLHGSFNAAAMALESAVPFHIALRVFNIIAAGMVLLAIALVASRRNWFFAKPAREDG